MPIEGRRFDTRFFMTRVPVGQVPAHDDRETTDGAWVTPRDAIARAVHREIVLPPPTWITLRELERHATVDGALAWAAARRVSRREPSIIEEDGARVLVMPVDEGPNPTATSGASRCATAVGTGVMETDVMERCACFLLAAIVLAAAPAAAAETMRVDYYHTGNSKEERFSLDRIVIEPLPWAGNPAGPSTARTCGKYFFEVIDAQAARLSIRGGSRSIYGEWETTGEAQSDEPHLFRVAPVSGRRQAGARGGEEARREERV